MANSPSLVRPARAEDAARIGTIHVAGLLRQLGAGAGKALPGDVVAMLSPAEVSTAWRDSITAPPSPKHQVLVALEGDEVVGFAALAPSDAENIDAEIVAFEVDPAFPGDVYPARLLNACADVLATAHASHMRIWLVRGDELRQRFLAESGFAPAGLRRKYEVAGAEVLEDAWWAAIGDPA